MNPGAHPLLSRLGFEVEWMIVDRTTLAARPLADRLLTHGQSEPGDVVRGKLAWCNELCLHVIELKSHQPTARLAELGQPLAEEVVFINGLLAEDDACLMPTAMHPTMDPKSEAQLWPHRGQETYAAFDRVFGARGHGFANLQSVHLNLSFANDQEFAQLHAAARALVPLLPALTASSPVVDGKPTACLNNRLRHYRDNCIRVPSVTGQMVPEPVFSRKDYEVQVLARIYQDLAELDPDGALQHEWVNARGAIARFERMSVELRLMDVQESPAQDLAMAALVTQVLAALAGGRLGPLAELKGLGQSALVKVMRDTVAYAHQAVVEDPALLAALGWQGGARAEAGALWAHLIHIAWPPGDPEGVLWRPSLTPWLEHGPLGGRMAQALGPRPNRERIHDLYRRLCACLAEGRPFVP